MRKLLIFAVFCIPFASDPPAKCADVVLLPETGVFTNDAITERFVFTGQSFVLQWLVCGENLSKFRKPVCEVYRVSGVTAAPVGELQSSYDASLTEKTAALLLSTKFDVPPSGRPSRFLLKAWNETGDGRSLLAMVFIRAIPANLDFLSGRIVHAVAFSDEDRSGWGHYLESQGVRIRWSRSYPKSPGKSDRVFLHLNPENLSPVPTAVADRGPFEIHFEKGNLPESADRITTGPGKSLSAKLNCRFYGHLGPMQLRR